VCSKVPNIEMLDYVKYKYDITQPTNLLQCAKHIVTDWLVESNSFKINNLWLYILLLFGFLNNIKIDFFKILNN
jgi:hypothetical protein